MDAVRTCLIRAGGDHAAFLGAATHDNRLAAPFGMIELLHAREERIEVQKPDGGATPCAKEHIGKRRRIEGFVVAMPKGARFQRTRRLQKNRMYVRYCSYDEYSQNTGCTLRESKIPPLHSRKS